VSEPADEGNAGHEVMRQIAETDATNLDLVDLVAIGQRFGVDPDELRSLAWNGLWVWKQIREAFAGAKGEADLAAEIGSVTLTGHVDLLSIRDDVAHLIDWKFGRVDRDHAEQVRGYAALVLRRYPEVQRVSMAIAWMRDRELEPYSMTREQLPAWEARFTGELADWDGVFHPGPGCWACPRSHECPAMTALARRDVEVLGGEEMAARMVEGLATLPDAEVVALRRKAKQIAKLIDSLDEAVKMRVDQAGGVLADGAGAELRFTESNRRDINPLKAWPVIQGRLDDTEIAGCLKISASSLDDTIAKKAGRGQGAAAKRALQAALEEAQAITLIPSRRLIDARTK
jgi:hypothetical protein